MRSLRLPLAPEQLRPLAPTDTRVQFSALPTDDELRQIAVLLKGRPDVALRAYGSYNGSIRDLEFLRFCPRLRRFGADALWRSLESLDGLRHLPEDLETLGLGSTKRRLSLRGLERFTSLRSLFLEGTYRDFNAVSRLTSLEHLTLRSVPIPDLSPLVPLERLRSLDLKLGGTRDLSLLPRIGRLEYVELWQIRGLEDVSAVAEIPTLQHLFLQSLKNVAQLPSFERSRELRRVDLQLMRGLTDLAPLAAAPALEILNLLQFNHAQPSILRAFVGHPRLRAGVWGFGSNKKNFEAQDLLPLPPEPHGCAMARRGEAGDPTMPWNRPEWTGFRRHEAA